MADKTIELKRNKKFKHVYVIIRWLENEPSWDLSERLAVTKVFFNLEKAEGEASRLNSLNSSKGYSYHVYLGRLASDLDQG